MANQVISLSGLVNFFRDDQNVVSKGETKYHSGFVLQVTIDGFAIKGVVRASMKDRSYKVGLSVNGEGLITSAECECPRGQWLCSHMAATAIYVNKKGMSKTDLPNSWMHRPKSKAKRESETKTISDLFPPTKPHYKAASRSFTEADRENFHDRLVTMNVDCPFRWILSPEPDTSKDSKGPPLIEDLLPLFASNKELFVKEVAVTREQQQWVAEATKLQSKSHLWGQYRRLRLTGSNFGLVLGAVKRNMEFNKQYPPSLFKTLKGEYNLMNKDSIMWGGMHEEVACKQYEEKTGNRVTSTGLHLFQCGYLGCSPDGIISSKEMDGPGALEIKCPWKYKDSSIKEMIEKEMTSPSHFRQFYLTHDLMLNNSHNYWHQVQAEMAVLGTKWAHFVVWTAKDMHVVFVPKDENWEKNNIPLLSDFYLNTLLPSFYLTE